MDGKISQLDFVNKYVRNNSSGAHRAIEVVNAKLSPEDSVLMLGESRTFYLKVGHLADYDMTARQLIPWLRCLYLSKGDPEGLRILLNKMRVRAIMVNFHVLKGDLARGVRENKSLFRPLEGVNLELFRLSLMAFYQLISPQVKRC
jgi:hypothetical protein